MEVGDYIRIDGYISKVIHIKTSSSGKTYVQWKQPNGLLASGNNNIIEKYSKNIIDLIEVGDYVNGMKVIDILENDIYVSDYYAENYIGIVKVKDIKSIVTCEMFENMEYRIGDKNE